MIAASSMGEGGADLTLKVGARVTRPTEGPVPGH